MVVLLTLPNEWVIKIGLIASILGIIQFFFGAKSFWEIISDFEGGNIIRLLTLFLGICGVIVCSLILFNIINFESEPTNREDASIGIGTNQIGDSTHNSNPSETYLPPSNSKNDKKKVAEAEPSTVVYKTDPNSPSAQKKRDTIAQVKLEPEQVKIIEDCERFHSGDFTITNRRSVSLDLNVVGLVHPNDSYKGQPVISGGGTTSFKVAPGETITIYNIIEGSYQYSAFEYNKSVSEGEIYFQKCITNHKDIR